MAVQDCAAFSDRWVTCSDSSGVLQSCLGYWYRCYSKFTPYFSGKTTLLEAAKTLQDEAILLPH